MYHKSNIRTMAKKKTKPKEQKRVFHVCECGQYFMHAANKYTECEECRDKTNLKTKSDES